MSLLSRKKIAHVYNRYVPELEQKDWAVICDSNAVCYGMRVLRVKEQPQETPISPDGNQSSNLKDEDLGLPAGIERARYPGEYGHPSTLSHQHMLCREILGN